MSNPNREETDRENARLLPLAQAGDRNAREQIVRLNMHFVSIVAGQLTRSGALRDKAIDANDLKQEGVVGLLQAIDKHDPALGAPFGAYAYRWIRGHMLTLLWVNDSTIRIPGHLRTDELAIRRATENFKRDSHLDPTPEDLADATGLPLDRVETVLTLPIVASLSWPTATEDHAVGELGDTIADPHDAFDALAEAEVSAELRQELVEALEQLDDRRRFIVTKRYGLDDDDPLTYKSIGQQLGIGGQRTAELHNQALLKIRTHLGIAEQPKPQPKLNPIRFDDESVADRAISMIVQEMNNARTAQEQAR